MSSRTAAGRKRLQHPPPPKVSPTDRSVSRANSFTPTTRPDLIPSTSRSWNVPRIHTSFQQLDLTNEFTQPLPSPEIPSPEYSPVYFPPSNHVHFRNIESNQVVEAVPSYGPVLHPQSNHRRSKWIESGEATRAVPTYEPPSPYEESIYQSRRPLLRVDPYVMKYEKLPLPPPPSPGILSRTPISPVTGPYLYVPDSPISPKYSPTNKHSEHLAASYSPRSPSIRQSHRLSFTPSDLPDYCSTYSTHVDIPPVAVTKKSTRKDNQFKFPSASRSSPPSPGAQLAASPISPLKNNGKPPFQRFPSSPRSLNHHSSDSNLNSRRSFNDPHRDSTASVYSSLSNSTVTSNGTWLPPAPPPSPNFFFPGSRSVARPRVTSKITISQLKRRRSKSRLHAERSQTSLVASLSPTSPTDDQMPYETSPVSPIVQTPNQSNHPDVWADESAFMHSDDHHRKSAPNSAPKAPPETLVFPTSRSRAQPKIPSKPKPSKRSSQSSKNKDENSGRLRILGALFKKKNKGKTPSINPTSKMYTKLSDPPNLEHTSTEKRVSEESGHEFTTQQERARKLKSKSGSYPLDPYSSVLLDNDRHTGELLKRLNRTGSPSFHDYGTTPPSSVLDLGCGQGHWVLEAAIAWKAYGTHVIGYDMVDISRNMLPLAAEQGVRDNIRFVRGNFLKQHLPFENGTFDLVRMSCLALCITSDSWGFVLQEVYRVLVAGGRLEFIDDQIFFPYGKLSSLMDIDDTNSIVESYPPPKVDSVLSPTVSTYSIYGDVFANPGLGSTVGLRGSDDHDHDDKSDLDGGGVVLHDQKGKVTAKLSTAQPRVQPSIALSLEAWDRSLSISEDLEALFEHMLLDTFDIHKDPSDFILSIMKEVFSQAREVETMNLVLAPPPDSTAKSGRPPQQGLSHCPGLILWPSTFIPMDHTEVEIHASKHLRSLLSCKNFLTQHAIEVAEDERVDEEFVSEALWEYENFLQHRFNPPIPSENGSDEELNASRSASIHNSTVESLSSYSSSFEAMLEIQSEFRQRYAWQPERPPKKPDTQDLPIIRTPVSAPPIAPEMTYEVTHVRTFRVFEAVKLDNYVSTYDNY